MNESVPQVLGPYHLRGKLAVGGQSEVWLGVRTGPGGFRRRCALKLVLPPASSDEAGRKSFFAEARLMALFDHPNLVAVTDIGEDDESEILFSVMPYVSGRSLASLMRELDHPFEVTDSLWLISRILLALSFAHDLHDERGRTLNIIHRDVSPENILLGFDGQVKLIDFGIALSSINPRSTRMHVVKGKLEYLSPEQATANSEIGPTTDIYSAGLILYTMLVGKNPLAGNPDTALARARQPNIQSIRDFGRFPPELDQMLSQMLAIDADHRPTDAGELAKSALKILHGLDRGYDEFQFHEAAARLLDPHLPSEREFLTDLLAEGTQVIDTTAFVTSPDGGQGASDGPVKKRRKTMPARPPDKRTPMLDSRESVDIAPKDDLDSIFQELEEIYED